MNAQWPHGKNRGVDYLVTALEALTKGRTVAATNRGAAAWLAELRTALPDLADPA